jgi:hypothetical protein
MIQEVCPNPVPLFQERYKKISFRIRCLYSRSNDLILILILRDDKVEVNHQCESTDSTYRPVYNQQSRNYYGGRPWYEVS